MALEGGEGSASRPECSLPLGKTRYPLYRRLDGPQDQYGQVQKISPPPGFDPQTVEPVAILTELPGPHCRTVQSLEFTKLSERLCHWNQSLKQRKKTWKLITIHSCTTLLSLLQSPLSPPPHRPYTHHSSHIIHFNQMCMKNLRSEGSHTDSTQNPWIHKQKH